MHQVDQIFGQLRRNLLFNAVREVEADVCFEHLRHKAVDATTHRGKLHQLTAAVLIGCQRALDRVELAAELFQPLHELEFFAFLMGHGAAPLIADTHPGYSINQRGV
jgi:hypothetical protein